MKTLRTFTLFGFISVVLSTACSLGMTETELIEQNKKDLQSKKWELTEINCSGISSNNFDYSSFEFLEDEVIITYEQTNNGVVEIVSRTENYDVYLSNYNGKFTISFNNFNLIVNALGKDQLVTSSGDCYNVYE
jgi:hypothetical protein